MIPHMILLFALMRTPQTECHKATDGCNTECCTTGELGAECSTTREHCRIMLKPTIRPDPIDVPTLGPIVTISGRTCACGFCWDGSGDAYAETMQDIDCGPVTMERDKSEPIDVPAHMAKVKIGLVDCTVNNGGTVSCNDAYTDHEYPDCNFDPSRYLIGPNGKGEYIC